VTQQHVEMLQQIIDEGLEEHSQKLMDEIAATLPDVFVTGLLPSLFTVHC